MKVLLFFVSVLFLNACSKSGEVVSADNDLSRGPLELKNSYSPNGSQIKSGEVSAEKLNSMFRCNEKTPTGLPTFLTQTQRLIGFKYSMKHNLIERTLTAVNTPYLVKQFNIGYSTQNHGLNFVNDFVTEKMMVGSENALTGPIGYKQSCEANKKCDENVAKEFYLGTTWDAAMALTNYEKLINQAGIHYATKCSGFAVDLTIPENKPEISYNAGTYTFQNGETVAVYEVVEKIKADIKCDLKDMGNLGLEKVGMGTIVNKKIIAVEELIKSPLVENINNTIACPRTIIFKGSQVEFENKILQGNSYENINYVFDGDLKPQIGEKQSED